MRNENGVSRVQRRGREAVVAVWGDWAVANFVMSGLDNLILGWAHIFDEMAKNENRKMNPPFFLFRKSKTKTSGKQAEQKSPLYQLKIIRLHIFLIHHIKTFCFKMLRQIFLFFFFGVFLFSENGGQPGAALEGCEVDFLWWEFLRNNGILGI